MTGTDLSKLLDCSVQYISQLQKQGMPKETDGSYNINNVVPWYVKFLRDSKKTDEAQSKARKVLAEAQLKELELRMKQENLIDVDTAIEEITEVLTALKSRLTALGSKLAPQLLGLTPAEVEALVTKHIAESLNELSMLPDKLYAIETDKVEVEEVAE